MQKEHLSAFIDGESIDSDFIAALSKDKALQDGWRCYHLIRDTLRAEPGNKIRLDIAEQVAAALTKEPIYNTGLIARAKSSPNRWQEIALWPQIQRWAGQLTQVGVAACVSLIVIVGVQYHNGSQQVQDEADPAVLVTIPVGGFTSPVSYGIPSEVNDGQIRRLQEQRERIDRLLQDYELRRQLNVQPSK